MKINEIFYSLQGEGFLAGVTSIFVRLAGCPLRCKWCDTKYAWDENAGSDYSIDEIVQEVANNQRRFVVLTGGEPMINPDLPQLVRKIKDCGKHITIETAGINFVPGLACDLMSISPKLNNAAPQDVLDIAVLEKLIGNYNYQIKFVVDSPGDLTEILQVLKKIGKIGSEKVMLMPQAQTRDELLIKSPMVAELCKKFGFVFGARLHIMLWDNKKGV
jgi:7-carboxy-7-deazaguanine synthase